MLSSEHYSINHKSASEGAKNWKQDLASRGKITHKSHLLLNQCLCVFGMCVCVCVCACVCVRAYFWEQKLPYAEEQRPCQVGGMAVSRSNDKRSESFEKCSRWCWRCVGCEHLS
jgi:hypothetical protein